MQDFVNRGAFPLFQKNAQSPLKDMRRVSESVMMVGLTTVVRNYRDVTRSEISKYIGK